MSSEPAFDEDLVRQLPMPLARLYRQAHNVSAPLNRHLAAYYLWEVSLRLVGATAVAICAQRGEPSAQVLEGLSWSAKPTLGQWWGLVQRLVAELARTDDPGFRAVCNLLLDRNRRTDLPRAAGLEATVREVLHGTKQAGTAVRLGNLFDTLVTFRNRAIAHASIGQGDEEKYARMGSALLAGMTELLRRLDVLAGRRLVYVSKVELTAAGFDRIELFELKGETWKKLEPVERTETETGWRPRPGRLYLAEGGLLEGSLHPLLIYQVDTDEFLFFNGMNRRRGEYLDYARNTQRERSDLSADGRLLVARLLDLPAQPDPAEPFATEPPVDDEPTAARWRRYPEDIGGFTLLSKLGEGGMGVVFRAWQPGVERQVALKCLRHTNKQATESRFRREIHALGRVEHGHLVKIYTSGSEGHQWFYAMELVEGATLASVGETIFALELNITKLDGATWRKVLGSACKKAGDEEAPLSDEYRPQSPRQPLDAAPEPDTDRGYVLRIVEYIRQVADAAHALHEAGIIHRDIKPGNIIISTDGSRAVLMDLGLAQLADELDRALTRTREFIGTLRYASPEQVMAVGGIDRRTDVYSLGATLWELLTLQPIYGASETISTLELMKRIQFADPGRIGRHHGPLSKNLDAVLEKCLEKNPEHRYATARELAEDLGRFLAGEPVHARPTPAYQRALRWLRRRPQVAALLLGNLVVLALVATGAWYSGQSGSYTVPTVPTRESEPRRPMVAAAPATPVGESRAAAGPTVLGVSALNRVKGPLTGGILEIAKALKGAATTQGSPAIAVGPITAVSPPPTGETIADELTKALGKLDVAVAPDAAITVSGDVVAIEPRMTLLILTVQGSAGKSLGVGRWVICEDRDTIEASPEAADKLKLAQHALTFLKKYCYRCHGQRFEVPELNVMDRDMLVTKRSEDKKLYVDPGDPAESELWLLVGVSKTMPPPEEPNPTDQERAEIHRWIQAGAPFPTAAAAPVRTPKTEKDVLIAIRDDLRQSSVDDRVYRRYFSLDNLWNNRRVEDEDLRTSRAALSKLLNSLSWETEIVLPRAVDQDGVVYAVDLRDLGWEAKRYDQVLKHYRYGLLHTQSGDPVLKTIAEEIASLSGTPLPYVRADWLIANASRPPLYQVILDLPATASELEQRLRVDVASDFLRDRIARAGVVSSDVSLHNRVIDRHPSLYGGYWKTYDFDSSGGSADLFRFPVGPDFPENPFSRYAFKQSSSEVLFALPNGLMAYLATDSHGNGVDVEPTTIVSDSQEISGSPAVVEGLSCLGCHKSGIMKVEDSIRKALDVNAAPRNKVMGLFSQDTMDRLVARDRDRFLKALKEATAPFLAREVVEQGPDDLPEPIAVVARRHRQDLGLEEIASELGLDDPRVLKVAIRAFPELQRLGLGPLANGGRISRADFESKTRFLSLFQEIALVLGTGIPWAR